MREADNENSTQMHRQTYYAKSAEMYLVSKTPTEIILRGKFQGEKE
jgi:hypothetical protein